MLYIHQMPLSFLEDFLTCADGSFGHAKSFGKAKKEKSMLFVQELFWKWDSTIHDPSDSGDRG